MKHAATVALARKLMVNRLAGGSAYTYRPLVAKRTECAQYCMCGLATVNVRIPLSRYSSTHQKRAHCGIGPTLRRRWPRGDRSRVFLRRLPEFSTDREQDFRSTCGGVCAFRRGGRNRCPHNISNGSRHRPVLAAERCQFPGANFVVARYRTV